MKKYIFVVLALSASLVATNASAVKSSGWPVGNQCGLDSIATVLFLGGKGTTVSFPYKNKSVVDFLQAVHTLSGADEKGLLIKAQGDNTVVVQMKSSGKNYSYFCWYDNQRVLCAQDKP